MSDNNQTQAIVPVGETGLAAPRRFWQKKPRTKRRCYVTLSPPSERYRESGEMQAGFETRVVEDLSEGRLSRDREPLYMVPVATLIFIAHVAAAGAIGVAIFGDFGMFAVFAGYATGYITGKSIISAVARRVQNMILAGRPDETTEIDDGVKWLVCAATGEAEFCFGWRELPVESLFRALGHEDAAVRRYAADVVAQLPKQVRLAGIAAYSKYLSLEHLKLLPGMENMTPEISAAHDSGQQQWPEDLETLSA
ncbi:MAG: hypothetical protein V1738_03310 [Patescibacteria group bacterium]